MKELEITIEEAGRIYNYVRDAYKRNGFKKFYNAMDEWDSYSDEEKEQFKEDITKTMGSFGKYNNAEDILRSFYEFEEKTVELMREAGYE